MHPRCWLPRRSRWLERNQCRSLSYLRDVGSPFSSGLSALGGRIFVSGSDIALALFAVSTRIVDKLARDHLDTPPRKALTGLHQRMGGELFG